MLLRPRLIFSGSFIGAMIVAATIAAHHPQNVIVDQAIKTTDADVKLTRFVNVAGSACDLPASSEQADLIVVGKLNPIPECEKGRRLARIEVSRILKCSNNISMNDIVVDTYYGATFDKGMYILKRQHNGLYQCLYGAYLDALPAVKKSSKKELEDAGNASAVIADEMLAVLGQPVQNLDCGGVIESGCRTVAMIAVQQDKKVSIKRGSGPRQNYDCTEGDFQYAKAVGALRSLPPNVALPKMKEYFYRKQTRGPAHIWLANALYSMKDYHALDKIQDILMSDQALDQPNQCAMDELCKTIEGYMAGVTTSYAYPDAEEEIVKAKVVSGLLKSKRLQVRLAAALELNYLGHTDTSKAIITPLLEQVNLHDTNQLVRYRCYSALGEIKSLPYEDRCTYVQFKADEGRYIDTIRKASTVSRDSL